jgi:hypothetical protein
VSWSSVSLSLRDFVVITWISFFCRWKSKHKEEVKTLTQEAKVKKKTEVEVQRAEARKQKQEAKLQWEGLLEVGYPLLFLLPVRSSLILIQPVPVPSLNEYKWEVLATMLEQGEFDKMKDPAHQKRVFLIKLYRHHCNLTHQVGRKNLARRYIRKKFKELGLRSANEKCEYVEKNLSLVEGAFEDLAQGKKPTYEDKHLFEFWSKRSMHGKAKETLHQEHDDEKTLEDFSELLQSIENERASRVIVEEIPHQPLQRTLSMMPNLAYEDLEEFNRVEDL